LPSATLVLPLPKLDPAARVNIDARSVAGDVEAVAGGGLMITNIKGLSITGPIFRVWGHTVSLTASVVSLTALPDRVIIHAAALGATKDITLDLTRTPQADAAVSP
jgi:hypothetical protein